MTVHVPRACLQNGCFTFYTPGGCIRQPWPLLKSISQLFAVYSWRLFSCNLIGGLMLLCCATQQQAFLILSCPCRSAPSDALDGGQHSPQDPKASSAVVNGSTQNDEVGLACLSEDPLLCQKGETKSVHNCKRKN